MPFLRINFWEKVSRTLQKDVRSVRCGSTQLEPRYLIIASNILLFRLQEIVQNLHMTRLSLVGGLFYLQRSVGRLFLALRLQPIQPLLGNEEVPHAYVVGS